MKVFSLIMILGIGCFLGGCSSEVYKKQKIISYIGPARIGSGGYTDSKIDDEHYYIRYCDPSNYHQALHLAMIRAAEITINTGHQFFSIDDITSSTSSFINEKSIGYKLTNEKKTIEDRSKLQQLLKNKYTIKNWGDTDFLIKDWDTLSVAKSKYDPYPPIVLIKIGVYKENPGFFVFKAENVYRDLKARYIIQGKNKTITDEKRITYTIYQIDENHALIGCARGRFDTDIDNLGILASAEFAHKKGFKYFKFVSGAFHNYSDPIFNKTKESVSDMKYKANGVIHYAVIKMNNDSDNKNIACDETIVKIRETQKVTVQTELDKIKPVSKNSGNIKLNTKPEKE